MNHLSLPRSLLILHHNHFFQIESDQRRARNFRQRFQFLKALADPSLWPFKLDPISMISKLDPIFELKADLWQWFQIGIILWPLHVNPCDNYFKALMGQFQNRTISRWRRDQDQRRQVKLTPPWWRFVKMPQEHDRNFIYVTFLGWSKWLSENQSFFGAATKVGLCLNFQGGWFHFYQTQSI